MQTNDGEQNVLLEVNYQHHMMLDALNADEADI